MSRDEMRAADADRQAVAEKLRVALDEGRLDLHEYDDRLRRAYEAKTYGDLDPLLADLPGAPAVATGYEPPKNPTAEWLAEVWSSWVPVFVITSAIWGISSAADGVLDFYWPVWVVGPWAAILLVATVAGLLDGEPQKMVDKRRRKALEKERKALGKERRNRERERRAIEQQDGHGLSGG